jgi:hypothetical protein
MNSEIELIPEYVQSVVLKCPHELSKQVMEILSSRRWQMWAYNRGTTEIFVSFSDSITFIQARTLFSDLFKELPVEIHIKFP